MLRSHVSAALGLLAAVAFLSGCSAREEAGLSLFDGKPARSMPADQKANYQEQMKAPIGAPAPPQFQDLHTGSAGPAGPAGPMAMGGASSPRPAPNLNGMPVAGSAPTPKPIVSPDMYVSSTYIGGSGERDRVEKLVREGVLVDGKRVKLEAFPHDYAQTFPIPTDRALNLVVDTERSKIVEQGEHTYLQVGLQAQKGEAPRRPPLNLALVLDRSGSMDDEGKMEYARLAAARLVDGLLPGDRFALVTFDDDAQLLVPSRRAGDRRAIQKKLAAIQPGDSTNIYDGLKLGYAEVAKHAAPDSVNRVLLLSDGEVTAGVQDEETFGKLVTQNAAREIQTTAIGLGVQYDERLMLGLAQEGRGNYHFIKDAGDAGRVFKKELEELTHTVAQAVRLRIVLAPGVGLVRVLGSRQLGAGETQELKTEEKRLDRKAYEELGIRTDRQRLKEEPGIKMLIPSFYRGDSHVVMLELAVPPGRGSRKLADVFLTYKDLPGRANRKLAAAAAIRYTPSRGEMVASVKRSVTKNLLGFRTGEVLTRAADLVGQGRYSEAVKLVDERMAVLGLAAKEWGDRDLDRDGRLLDRYRRVLADLGRGRTLASAELGEYVKKSLTYAGYELTR
jgi:Ca-activated chloride channel family protein